MCYALNRAVFLLCVSSLFFGGMSSAQEPPLSTAMREEIVLIKKQGGVFTTELETTFFRPPGTGPFPVAIINHGKSPVQPKFQSRFRGIVAARELVSRGYMVALPNRQGFSKSTGIYVGGGCNVQSNGEAQADDVVATIQFIQTVADADAKKIVVLGQSHGGLTTIALGSLGSEKLAGVKGLINFAGGLRNDGCTGWEATLARAFGSYGRLTTLPSLWFYGDNDSYFQPWLFKDMHKQYVDAGGAARLVAFGVFSGDSHSLFGSPAGVAIWAPEVDAFLAQIGLPNQKIHRINLIGHQLPPPAASGFAKFNDETAVPFLKENGRAGYLRFLQADRPKAFAIAPNGAWAYFVGRADAMKVAVDRCNENAKADVCKLYSVDDEVVWLP